MYTDIKRKIYQYATTSFYKRKMKNRALAVLFFIDSPSLPILVPLFPSFAEGLRFTRDFEGGNRLTEQAVVDESDADDEDDEGGGKEIRINYQSILVVERNLSGRRGI